MTFSESIHHRIRQTDSRVCLGIDPRPSAHQRTHPDTFSHHSEMVQEIVFYFQEIIAATADLVACYKLQSAFFEALGMEGLHALQSLAATIRQKNVPMILDAKRGDIGSTAEAYAAAYLSKGVFRADALTVNPYLGRDSLAPFVKRAVQHDKGIFVLVKTSNAGSDDLQEQSLADGSKLYDRVVTMLNEFSHDTLDGKGYSPIGAVVGATKPQHLQELRQKLPHALLLVPGYGAQGGSAEDCRFAFDAEGLGALISSSRALTYSSQADNVGEIARANTLEMRDALNSSL